MAMIVQELLAEAAKAESTLYYNLGQWPDRDHGSHQLSCVHLCPILGTKRVSGFDHYISLKHSLG